MIVKKEKIALEHYEAACNKLADYFVKKYFGKDASDVWWISDDIGGCLQVNDYFFDMDRIYEAIKFKATKKQVFDFYDDELECATKNKTMKMNFKKTLVKK